ncbi:MAG TPA: TlpA disulfide reductase family protein [Spirochaetia bacterium]|nr:TlpA disulfide reductase family protein [Spirochaetia bacterium]
MKKLILLVIVALAVSVSGYAADIGTLIDRAGLRPLKPGVESIDFQLDNLAGKTVSLSSYRGDVVLLNFWATWCGPCRSEMGSIESLYNEYKDKGFVVLAVNLQEDPATVSSFVKQFGLTFPVVLDRSGRVGYTYNARGIPTTYLINKKGEVTSGFVGAHEWNTAEMGSLLQAMLTEN